MKASVTCALSPATATVWKQRYEALRQLAISGRQILEADPLGLVLLLRQGVAGWMRSWSESGPTPAPRRASVAEAPVVPASAWQHQLTEVLAAMSLAHLPNEIRL
jgi:hypothetical protein